MESRINHASVAFAADDGALLVHKRGDIDLTDSGSIVCAAVALSHIAERP